MKRVTLLSILAVPAFLMSARAAMPVGGVEVELDEAEVFVEFNSTDSDFGIQFFWDGEPWHRMSVEGPDGRHVLRVKAQHSVAEQGMTEGFFESAEPSADKLSMEQFFERFPKARTSSRARPSRATSSRARRSSPTPCRRRPRTCGPVTTP